MRIAVIINSISRKKKHFFQQALPALQQKFSVEVFETRYANHAIQLATSAAAAHFDVILSAGGDGTLNQVVNGMLNAGSSWLPMLGIIPLGSGNDFATLMNITGNADQLISLLEASKPRFIDVGKITCMDVRGEPVEKYFINVCSTGMGPATVLRLEKLPRWMGTAFRYYASVLNTFLTHPPEQFEVRTHEWNWQGSARVIAIANGQSFGNKIYIAPNARPDDGRFSTFIATDMPLLKFLFVLQKVKMKQTVVNDCVHYNKASELQLSSPQRTWVETEGELAGLLPARVELLQGKIPFLG